MLVANDACSVRTWLNCVVMTVVGNVAHWFVAVGCVDLNGMVAVVCV